MALQPPCTKTLEYFECLVAYKFTEHFVSGSNKIEFTVNNIGGVSNPVGLYVNFYI